MLTTIRDPQGEPVQNATNFTRSMSHSCKWDELNNISLDSNIPIQHYLYKYEKNYSTINRNFKKLGLTLLFLY